MDGPVWLSIGSVGTSSGVAIGAVLLAAKFAATQADLGRVWERKADAYSAILEALHEMHNWYSVEMDDEYARREVDQATSDKRIAALDAARGLLRRSLAQQTWLLPEGIESRIAAMNKAVGVRQESWFEHLDVGLFEVGTAIKDITALAVTDQEHR